MCSGLLPEPVGDSPSGEWPTAAAAEGECGMPPLPVSLPLPLPPPPARWVRLVLACRAVRRGGHVSTQEGRQALWCDKQASSS